MEIVSIGDNCVDVYADKKLGFPGGGCVNFSVYAARLGLKSNYVGAVGEDICGAHIQLALKKENVGLSGLQIFEGNTALAFIRIHETDRTFLGSEPGVRYEFKITKNVSNLIQRATLLHTTIDGGVDNYLHKWSKEGILISYDFSDRPLYNKINLLPYINIAFFSEQDSDLEDVKNKARQYQSLGKNIVVITRGKKGSLAFDGNDFFFCEARKISPIVDTLGCGDAFIASFVVSFLSSKSVPLSLKAGTKTASSVLKNYGAFGYGKTLKQLNIDLGQFKIKNLDY